MTRNSAVARVFGRTAAVVLVAAYGLTMASVGSASASSAPGAAVSVGDVRSAPAETVSNTGWSDEAPAATSSAAWAWVRSMLGTSTPVTSTRPSARSRSTRRLLDRPDQRNVRDRRCDPPPVTTAAWIWMRCVIGRRSGSRLPRPGQRPGHRAPAAQPVDHPGVSRADGQPSGSAKQTLVRPDGTFDLDLLQWQPRVRQLAVRVLDAQAGYALLRLVCPGRPLAPTTAGR